MNGFWEAAAGFSAANRAFVVITLLEGRGHVPQDKGAKAIVLREGLAWGTVGGGKVEARAIQEAREILAGPGPSEPRVRTWNLQRDIGMTCGGEVTYLFERHGRDWEIAVFGAGHVAQALVPLLKSLPCSLICVDPRPEWIEKLPAGGNLRVICQAEPAAVVPQLSGATFFVSVSQGHAHDLPVLEAIFQNHPDARYVGVIGSKGKALKIRNDLLARGLPAAWIEKIRCPIGLPIGSNHPGEIAISIAAELLQVRDRARE